MMNRLERYSKAILVAAGLVLASVSAGAGSGWELDWWTIDGGGEVFTTGDGWELSGTLGQWDGTARTAAGGGAWEVTGGFWAVSVDASDRLFSDGFE